MMGALLFAFLQFSFLYPAGKRTILSYVLINYAYVLL